MTKLTKEQATLLIMINGEQLRIKREERNFIKKLIDAGYTSSDVIKLHGSNLHDAVRVSIANKMRDKERGIEIG